VTSPQAFESLRRRGIKVRRPDKTLATMDHSTPTLALDLTLVDAPARLVAETLSTFGKLNVLVHSAGIFWPKPFAEAPLEEFDAQFAVNVRAPYALTRAALPHLRRRRGVLINTASVDSAAAFPYFGAYVASKWALRGFAASLRQELLNDDVEVCTILPAAIDTPLFQHAANYMGRALKALNPTYDPEQVAQAMVRCAEQGGPREVIVGGAGRMLALQYTLAPGLSERLFRKQVEVDHFDPSQPARSTDGNVLAPMAEGTSTTGGWKSSKGHALPTPVLAGLAAASLPVLGWLLARRRQRAPLRL
jgi:NAD(P)-dependent dehydrogenase (short-subunit alcohol dehydrogenase family)